MKIHPEIANEFVDAFALSGNEATARRQTREIALAETQAFLRTIVVDDFMTLRAEFDRLYNAEKRVLRELKRVVTAARPDGRRITSLNAESDSTLRRLYQLKRILGESI